MYRLTTIKRLIRRGGREFGLMAVAVAALISLSTQPALAQDNTNNAGTRPTQQLLATMVMMGINNINDAGTPSVVHAGSIGLVPGQSVNVSVPNSYIQDGSVRFFVKHSIRVYEPRISHGITERESGLVYSGESGGLNESMHIFTFSYSNLPVSGEPRTGRVDFRVEVESFPPSATETRTENRSAAVLPPVIELKEENGRTVVFGLLLPVAPAQARVSDTSNNRVLIFLNSATFEQSVGVVEGQTVRLTIDVFDNAAGGLQLEMSRSLRVALYGEPTAGQTVRIRIDAADAADSSTILRWEWSYDDDGRMTGVRLLPQQER
jgi:hypothetical protein